MVEIPRAAKTKLRGRLAEDFASGGTHVDEESKQLLKFHGIYQQDDRDLRRERRRAGREQAYSFMLRSRIGDRARS